MFDAGAYLLNCAHVETKIGESQKRFEEKVSREIVTPLKAFLELDIKTIQVGAKESVIVCVCV